MKILELFSGTKSVSDVYKKRGYEVFTIDINPSLNPDLCINILDLKKEDLPLNWQNPDIIWASPPCQTFSVMSISKYWSNKLPKCSKTYIGLAIVLKTIELIKLFNPKYYFIENPVGMMRKQYFMLKLPRKTVTYCQYGMRYRKATDIWTNSTWIPRKTCKNGDLCHEEARRGMRRGIQGISRQIPAMANWANNSLERGKIPVELTNEIIDYIEGKQDHKQTTL